MLASTVRSRAALTCGAYSTTPCCISVGERVEMPSPSKSVNLTCDTAGAPVTLSAESVRCVNVTGESAGVRPWRRRGKALGRPGGIERQHLLHVLWQRNEVQRLA